MHSAYRTLFALFAADGLGGEREELLASGVPAHRIAALYPLDFSSIADTLRAYIARAGRIHTFGVVLRDDFTAADEVLWDSLDAVEKRRVMSAGKVIFEDDEIKYDLVRSPQLTYYRMGETAASQANSDLNMLAYAAAYLLHNSARREAAAEHLLDVATCFLPDLNVAAKLALSGKSV